METVSLHWCSLCNKFLDFLFPPRCLGCLQVGALLCPECLSQVHHVEPPICSRCGDAVVVDGLCPRCRTFPLSHVNCIRSEAYFEGVLREAVHQLKYKGRTALAEPLGGLMAAYWGQHPMPADVLIPVPLHAARQRERGYNQAGLLAREMARRVGLAVDEQTLVRQRATSPQVGLNAVQRGQNVRDAFRCSASRRGS